jgi:hypothetical protein
MERSVREGRQNRSRSRLQEEGEEGYTGSYRKDDKKKKYTNSRPKVLFPTPYMYCQSYCNMCVHLHQPFQPGLQPK